MADVDDELLALAGGDTSEEDSSAEQPISKPSTSSRPKPKPATASSSKKRPSKSKSSGNSKKKQRRNDDDDEDEEEDDSEDEEESRNEDQDEEEGSENSDEDIRKLYPVDGIYQSVQERDEFLDMPELERENILAQRRDELNAAKQESELKRLVDFQQASKKKPLRNKRSGSGSSSDSDSDYAGASKGKGRVIKKKSTTTKSKRSSTSGGGSQNVKAEKLQELKKRREVKAKQGAKRDAKAREDYEKRDDDLTSEDDDDEEEDESSGYEDEEFSKKKCKNGKDLKEKRKDGGSTEPPSLKFLNNCRLTREIIEKIMFRPGWDGVMRGMFIRYRWQEKDREGKPIEKYRIHEILSTSDGKRHYDLGGGKFTRLCVEVDFDNRRQALPMSQISNSDFSEQERERWILIRKNQSTGRSKGKEIQVTYPSHQELMEQAEELQDFLSKPLTDSEVSKMLASKKEARLTWEEERKNGKSSIANSIGNGNGNGSFSSSGTSRNGGATSSEKAMAEMNAKHRFEDRARVYEAERKNAALKRAAMGLSGLGGSGNGSGTSTPIKTKVEGEKKERVEVLPPTTVNQGGKLLENDNAHSIDVDLGDF